MSTWRERPACPIAVGAWRLAGARNLNDELRARVGGAHRGITLAALRCEAEDELPLLVQQEPISFAHAALRLQRRAHFRQLPRRRVPGFTATTAGAASIAAGAASIAAGAGFAIGKGRLKRGARLPLPAELRSQALSLRDRV